jgi:hypothetical protein
MTALLTHYLKAGFPERLYQGMAGEDWKLTHRE